MKAKRTADLEVVSISDTQERIEVAVPVTPEKDLFVKCGVKVCDKKKKTLALGDIVEIEYQVQLPSGSLRHPVFIRKREKGKEVNIDEGNGPTAAGSQERAAEGTQEDKK
jgi:hypothetical protein